MLENPETCPNSRRPSFADDINDIDDINNVYTVASSTLDLKPF